MLSTSDFKRGTRVLFDGEPFTLLDVSSRTPSARGANTLIKVRARSVLTGQMVAKTFKAGERFEEPDLETRVSQFLYREGEVFFFMDLESYEQHEMRAEDLGDTAGYLLENAEVKVLLFESRPVAVTVPNTVDLVVVETEPAVRGDTVNSVSKDATLETGLVVQVPMFIAQDEKIRVDTRDGHYVERAK